MADTKPIYKRVNGEWKKQTAFQRQNGEWVKISDVNLTYALINNDTEYEVSGYTGTPVNVTIPKTYNGKPVTSIGDDALSYCRSLKSVTIGDSVTSIGDDAFAACSSLTSVTIPNSVTSIGEGAFAWCSSLTIYCEAESQPSGWDDFWNFSNCPVVWGYDIGLGGSAD